MARGPNLLTRQGSPLIIRISPGRIDPSNNSQIPLMKLAKISLMPKPRPTDKPAEMVSNAVALKPA